MVMSVAATQLKNETGRVLDAAADPRPHDSKKLVASIYHRVDVGEYRIVYTFGPHCSSSGATVSIAFDR